MRTIVFLFAVVHFRNVVVAEIVVVVVADQRRRRRMAAVAAIALVAGAALIEAAGFRQVENRTVTVGGAYRFGVRKLGDTQLLIIQRVFSKRPIQIVTEL